MKEEKTLMIPKAIYSGQSIQLKYPLHTSLSLTVPCRMHQRCGNQGFRCTSLPKEGGVSLAGRAWRERGEGDVLSMCLLGDRRR